MPEISLTDFVDFVVRAGTPKLTKVRQLKERGEYEPAIDFWKQLRELIVEFHRKGGRDKSKLDRILPKLTDQKKRNRYPEAVIGYQKFLGRKKTDWFDPPRSLWSVLNMHVRINPELGLVMNDDRCIIKLYFKDEKLEKRKVDLVLALMEETLRPELKPKDQIAILDVSNSQLFKSSCQKPDLLPLLIGEAASFVTIWDQL